MISEAIPSFWRFGSCLFQKWHPVPGEMGVGCADHNTTWATHQLDSEEAGVEIIIKYVYRKQEWQQRRVEKKNILPVCHRDGRGVNSQADLQSPWHHLKSIPTGIWSEDYGCRVRCLCHI